MNNYVLACGLFFYYYFGNFVLRLKKMLLITRRLLVGMAYLWGHFFKNSWQADKRVVVLWRPTTESEPACAADMIENFFPMRAFHPFGSISSYAGS